jgi:hypothetical protein
MVFNSKKQIIKIEQFDEHCNSTYFETFNPITKRGFVRQFENGQKVEKTYDGSVIIAIKKFDKSGNLIYHEEFNPKSKVRKF